MNIDRSSDITPFQQALALGQEWGEAVVSLPIDVWCAARSDAVDHFRTTITLDNTVPSKEYVPMIEILVFAYGLGIARARDLAEGRV